MKYLHEIVSKIVVLCFFMVKLMMTFIILIRY